MGILTEELEENQVTKLNGFCDGFYVLFEEYDSTFKAVGPFATTKEAKIFCAGIETATSEEVRLLAIVNQLYAFPALEVEKPELTD